MIQFTCPLKSVDRVVISPDGKYLAAAGGSNRNVFVWNTHNPETLLHRYNANFDKRFWHFQFEPTSNILVVGNRFGMTGYDPQSMNEVWEIPTQNEYSYLIEGFDIDPITSRLVFAVHNVHTPYSSYETWQRDKANDWDKQYGVRGPDNDLSQAVACIPDSDDYVTAEDHYLETIQTGMRFTPQYRVVLRVAHKRKTKITIDTGTTRIGQLKVSRDGRFICAQFSKALLIWELETLTPNGENPPFEIKPPKKCSFTGIAFHPNGKYLATSCTNGTIALYDVTMWEPVREYTWDIGAMRSIGFNHGGELGVAGADGGRVVLWDMDE